ncbi:MAG: hypothetical protein EZS28_017916 [Streblomastix strix]|uniref:Uncharacterized protein n=1 Tax=Streblomastix strix TaxID=222440 RepID=A0A5J4VVR8_9EUKA|nr:MAG: hypothetical protein EZS28_017916 [Streblomastix strix]
MHNNSSALTYGIESNCNEQIRRYAHVWDIDIPFLKITEIIEVNFKLSNLYFGINTTILTLSPNTTNAFEQHEMRRTGTLNFCLNVTLFYIELKGPNDDIPKLSPLISETKLLPFGISFQTLFNPAFLHNPSSELRFKMSNVNTITNPFQDNTVLALDELRFKPADERNGVSRQLDQVQTSNSNNISASLHDSSHGSPLRKQEPIPGQSQMIKDAPQEEAVQDALRRTSRIMEGATIIKKVDTGNRTIINESRIARDALSGIFND